ncbi:MAG: glycosyltransferase [Candidatus Uhrbacteria bacterium]|nr:glycosyltransferase [Candidatus Uhrbacteria bacterium]
MSRPLVSIVIPSWNHGPELIHCLAALEVQTYHELEVTVVDDASTDGTQERLKSVHTRFPFKVIRFDQNQGSQVARNTGAKESRGEYLLFLDADVELRPHAIEAMVKALEQSGAQFAYPSFRFGWKLFRGYPFDAERLKRMPYIHTSALMRREVFPGFDESLKKFQDWDLWLTIVERGGKGVWIPEMLFTVKVRKEGMSHWLPSFLHIVPWRWFGWMPGELQKYRKWEKILKEKHGIR